MSNDECKGLGSLLCTWEKILINSNFFCYDAGVRLAEKSRAFISPAFSLRVFLRALCG